MAKRLVLFSQPSPAVWEKIDKALFPDYLKEKVIAYMPSGGGAIELNAQFAPIWDEYAKKNNATLLTIDNSKRGHEAEVESNKLKSANILIITGGNTFILLDHLRKSGLDKTIKEFWQKGNVVLSGFSAGAIVLTPKIDIASQPSGYNSTAMSDENIVGITDLNGLNIVDFEVWPHYYENYDRKTLDKYKENTQNEVVTINDDEIVIIDE